jgi:hypothetical protein
LKACHSSASGSLIVRLPDGIEYPRNVDDPDELAIVEHGAQQEARLPSCAGSGNSPTSAHFINREAGLGTS